MSLDQAEYNCAIWPIAVNRRLNNFAILWSIYVMKSVKTNCTSESHSFWDPHIYSESLSHKVDLSCNWSFDASSQVGRMCDHQDSVLSILKFFASILHCGLLIWQSGMHYVEIYLGWCFASMWVCAWICWDCFNMWGLDVHFQILLALATSFVSPASKQAGLLTYAERSVQHMRRETQVVSLDSNGMTSSSAL